MLVISIQSGLSLIIRNYKGSILGGILGFFAHKQYEMGLLLQRQASRAFSVMGIEHDIIVRMIFFIFLFAFVGAFIERKLIRRR